MKDTSHEQTNKTRCKEHLHFCGLSGAKNLYLFARGPSIQNDQRFFSPRQYEIAFMASAKPKPETIDEYLADVKPDQRVALEKLRRAIHATAPNAEECISYGIPAFRLNGRALVFFGAWAKHCAFYPGSSATLKRFRSDLKGFQISKGTIRFSPDNPLPVALVKKLVQARMTNIRG